MKHFNTFARGIGTAVALILISAPPAQAFTTIDLELPTALAGPSYSQDGFTLTNSVNSSLSYGNWLIYGVPDYNANGRNATIYQNFNGSSNTLTTTNSSVFDFFGISMANVLNLGPGGDVDFVFNYADGSSSSQTVTLVNNTGLQAFSF